MTDGGETTRLGDRQTGGENVMEKMRESKGEKKKTLHIYSASSGFALFLTFALACDNRAFKIKYMYLSSVKITARGDNTNNPLSGIQLG